MSVEDKGICVRILEKEFRVGCTKEHENALREAANYLDKQMRQIRLSGRVIGTERIAVMAALNIANELLMFKNAAFYAEEAFSERIRMLEEKIETALTPYNSKEDRNVILEALEFSEEVF